MGRKRLEKERKVVGLKVPDVGLGNENGRGPRQWATRQRKKPLDDALLASFKLEICYPATGAGDDNQSTDAKDKYLRIVKEVLGWGRKHAKTLRGRLW